MSDPAPDAGTVIVRFWASARAAAGVSQDAIEVAGATSLADVLAQAVARHPGADRLAQVVAGCSVLVGADPVGTRDHAEVSVSPGDTVELLPPFAGG